MAIKFVLVEIILVETVLVGDPLYIVHRAQLEIKHRLGALHALFIGTFKCSAINTRLTKILSKNVHFYACALLFSKSEVMLST